MNCRQRGAVESVILGFMAGAAVLLAIGQIGNALGVREKGSGHRHVLYRLWLTLTGDPINLKAAAVSVASVVLALLLRRAVRSYRLPQIDMFVVPIIVSGAAYALGWTRLEQGGHTAVAVVGTLKSGLPSPHIPEIHWNWIGQLSSSAVAIASLGLMEALSIAKSIAHHTRRVFTVALWRSARPSLRNRGRRAHGRIQRRVQARR
ncbi:SulP family inorganic anion transporter [Paraburkholderia youngii]|uniref:SulP family inorganic anion transporter n=1 Tax=Paraburkholderia youngii TaxID=2782701 RepID=UPI003D1C475B